VVTLLAVAVIAYLIGSIPSGYLVGKIAGIDIRKVGSGNVGATNVTRFLGKRFGYPVFLIDCGKGIAAVEVAQLLAKLSGFGMTAVETFGVLGAIFSVLGHSFPVWLGFEGGKGVATSIGALFALSWIAALMICFVWIVVFYTTRFVSLASIAAAIALPVMIEILLLCNKGGSPVLLYFALCLAAIVVLRHRSNISRLLKGTEPRFVRK
jgi:acyl phosphate:glycerol-3-phosphate acyltransferase